MKNLNYATILVLGFFFISLATNASALRNEFKEYEITTVNDIHMGKNVQAIWTVSYSDTEVPVTVIKIKRHRVLIKLPKRGVCLRMPFLRPAGRCHRIHPCLRGCMCPGTAPTMKIINSKKIYRYCRWN